MGIVSNSLLLLVYIRFDNVRTPINKVICVMTIFNLFGCVQFPLVIYSYFVHMSVKSCLALSCFYFLLWLYIFSYSFRWAFTELACILSGFVIYFVGCTQVYLMCALTLIRYHTLKEQVMETSISTFYVYASVVLSIVLSLFWAGMPTLGWSFYTLEGIFIYLFYLMPYK